MHGFRRPTAVVAGVLLLSGCAAGSQPGASGPSPSSHTSASPTPTAQPAVPPTADPATADPALKQTCDTVLTSSALADIVATGWMLQTELPGGHSGLMASMVEQGGLSCYWATAGGDVPLWYGQVPMDETAWNTQRTALMATGFTETDDPIPGTLQGERWGDDTPALVNSDGVTYYVNQPGSLTSVAALQ